MRRKLFVLIAIFFMVLPAAADEITFLWDYPQDVGQDGFRLYSGPMGTTDDGTWAPKYADDPLVSGIPPDSRTVTATEDGWPGVSKKFCFMMRAYRGDEESADSEFICTIIDNSPLTAPADLTASYEDEVITLAWGQPDSDRAKFWRVYYKIGGTEFVELAKVDNTGQTELTVQAPFDKVPPGSAATVYFVVVAFKDNSVYSPNSAEAEVVIDRIESVPPPPPSNIRFKIRIPIE
jgi:hypothetical protein